MLYLSTTVHNITKRESLYINRVAYQAGIYSMKLCLWTTGVFLLSIGWDGTCTPSQGTPQYLRRNPIEKRAISGSSGQKSVPE